MDADERALLNAIIADPDEDTPRLVYADWLQEHDRPERAELIRAQISLARSKDDDSAAQQRTLWQTRVRALLQTHSERWRKELPTVPRVRWGPFEHGMVESVTLKIRSWTSIAYFDLTTLFEHAPLRVLRVHFARWWDGHRVEECSELLGWSSLVRFNELHLATQSPAGFGNDDWIGPFLTPLWSHSWAARPQVLDLRGCKVPEGAVQLLLDGPLRPLPVLVFARRQFGESMRLALTARLGQGVRFE